MDYNNIAERLKKTLTSLNTRFDDDIAVYTTVSENTEKINEDSSKYTLKIEYKMGKHDHETLVNKIVIILYNIASLKDHLKNHIKAKGEDPKIVENEIENSLHLQVIIDIVNQEKHGYPLTKYKRSHKDPLIKDIRESYRITATAPPNKTGPFTSTIFFTQDGLKHVGHGKEEMVITANITDRQGNQLFTLDELVETSFAQFSKLA